MTSEQSAPTWIDACRTFAQQHDVPEFVLDDLAAFVTAHPRGGPPPGPEMAWATDFESLEAFLAAPLDADAVARVLAEEARGKQPAMFARRVAAVETILAELDSPAARILRVGVRVRLEAMCAAPPPRLRRVRALADFYYSLAARLRHPEWTEDERHLEELVADMRLRTAAPGIEHALIDGLADGMPIHANLLRVDPAQVRVDVADLHPATRGGAGFREAVAGRAAAAVSGGFFLYSETDIEPPSRRHDPVGLLLLDGVVHAPPVFRRAALLVGEDGVDVRRVGMADVGVSIAGEPVSLGRVWNRAEADVGPAGPSIAVVGREIVAVGTHLPVPLNGFIATLRGGPAFAVRAGMAVDYSPPAVGGRPAQAGIAGGPLLVEDGRAVIDLRAEDFWDTAPPITFSQDETGDRNLLARMAIGIDAEGRLVAAAIDGRNVQRALGMTLLDVARLMIRLGCVKAASLDGGSSKRMLVGDDIVDLPSTEILAGEGGEIRVRPVHTAILFQPRAD